LSQILAQALLIDYSTASSYLKTSGTNDFFIPEGIIKGEWEQKTLRFTKERFSGAGWQG